jgi:hypothetical protein
MGGFSGPDSGSWAYYITANFQLASVVNPAAVTAPYSIELWFWFPYLDGLEHDLFAWDGNVNPTLVLYVDTANKIHGSSPGSAPVDVAATTPRAWHHAVLTYDSTSTILYVDGAQVATGAGSSSGFTKTIYLGARAGANGMTGLLSNVASYAAKLSATRVAAHYNAAALKSFAPIFLAAGSSSFVTVAEAASGGQLDAILRSVRKVFWRMPPVTLPIIDQFVHPAVGLLTRVAVPGNPQAGPFIAIAPPQSILAITYGVVMRVHSVGVFHGRDVSSPVVFDPPLGRCSVLYNDLSGLAIVRQVTNWLFDNQNFMWDEPLPAAFQLYLQPDVTADLFYLQT